MLKHFTIPSGSKRRTLHSDTREKRFEVVLLGERGSCSWNRFPRVQSRPFHMDRYWYGTNNAPDAASHVRGGPKTRVTRQTNTADREAIGHDDATKRAKSAGGVRERVRRHRQQEGPSTYTRPLRHRVAEQFVFVKRVVTVATRLRTSKIFYLKIDDSLAHDEISRLLENR
jgi:hypothetical protein